MSELLRQLQGWRLTTAEILYRMPDHPSLVQTFVWQKIDLWEPSDVKKCFPELKRFCDWWQSNLDGPIVEVRVGASGIIAPARFAAAVGLFSLN